MLDMQELLEALGLNEVPVDHLLFVGAEFGRVAGAFHPFLDPGLLVGFLDMHEFDPDLGAIGLFHHLENPSQRRRFQPEDVIDENLAVVVGLGEAIARRLQLGMGRALLEPKRVEIGEQMTAYPVGANQHQGADRIEGGGANLLGSGAGERPRHRRRRSLGEGLDPVHAVGDHARPLGRPAGAAQLLQHLAGILVQTGEEAGPVGIDRIGIGEIALIKLLDEGAVGAEEEGVLFNLHRHLRALPVHQPGGANLAAVPHHAEHGGAKRRG